MSRPPHPRDELATMLGAFLAAKDREGIGNVAWAQRGRGEHQRKKLHRTFELGRRIHARLPPAERAAADAALRRTSIDVSDVALEQRIKRALRLCKRDKVFAARVAEWRAMFRAFHERNKTA